MTRRGPIDELLESRLIICSGAGGVGKTTMSAALALLAAKQGMKALVLTIDPARRLADSLGIGPLGNQEVQVPPERLKALGAPEGGELWAIMLDTKSTFDGMISRFARSAELRDQILGNRYYQQISRSMVGSHEYMAMEHLLSAYEKQRFDLVVLDTPPSRHALDFLRAPHKLRGVLEEGVLNWLLKPSTFLLKRLQRRFDGHNVKALDVSASDGFFQSMERLVGFGMLGDLSEFVVLFKDLLGDFKLRARETQDLLSAPSTSFLLVASPSSIAIQEAAFFREQLNQRGLTFGGAIINRVLPLAVLQPDTSALEQVRKLSEARWLDQFPKTPPDSLSQEAYHTLLEKLRRSLETLPGLAEMDRQNLLWLREQIGDSRPFVQLPEFPSDIHALEELDTLGQLMLDPWSWNDALESADHS